MPGLLVLKGLGVLEVPSRNIENHRLLGDNNQDDCHLLQVIILEFGYNVVC